MFRFTARGNPQAAFNFGAKSVNYYGQVFSRRHFARSHDAMRFGCVDPAALVGSLPVSAFASLWSLEGITASSLALTTEDSIVGILCAMTGNTAARMGTMPLSDCAVTLSRTLLSNAMAMQWTLCCVKLISTGP